MAGKWLTAVDLADLGLDEATADRFITMAEAQAVAAAPSLDSLLLTDLQLAQVKAVLVTAIKRWADAGSGANHQETVDGVSITLASTVIVGQLFPSEQRALERLTGTRRGWSIDTTPDENVETWPSWVVNRPETEAP